MHITKTKCSQPASHLTLYGQPLESRESPHTNLLSNDLSWTQHINWVWFTHNRVAEIVLDSWLSMSVPPFTLVVWFCTGGVRNVLWCIVVFILTDVVCQVNLPQDTSSEVKWQWSPMDRCVHCYHSLIHEESSERWLNCHVCLRPTSTRHLAESWSEIYMAVLSSVTCFDHIAIFKACVIAYHLP